MTTSLGWYIANFPEALYPVRDGARQYGETVIEGRARANGSSAVFCSLARDVAGNLPYFMARVEKLADSFDDFHIVIFENDSQDDTLSLLKQWSNHRSQVHIISEGLDHPRLSDMSSERTKNMAYYRNKYLTYIRENGIIDEVDYVFVADSDLLGGWSYEGIFHSLGWPEVWSVMASNGILYREIGGKLQRIFYDWWALRRLGSEKPGKAVDVNLSIYNRGEPPFQVNSAFGGLAIYKAASLRNDLQYLDSDCDHPTLHHQMRKRGHKIYLNPNQITLYSPTVYNIL